MRSKHDEIDVVRSGKFHDLLGPVTIDDLLTHHGVGSRHTSDGRRHDPRGLSFESLIRRSHFIEIETVKGLNNVKQRDTGPVSATELQRDVERLGGTLGQICRDEDSLEHRKG